MYHPIQDLTDAQIRTMTRRELLALCKDRDVLDVWEDLHGERIGPIALVTNDGLRNLIRTFRGFLRGDD